MCCSIGFIEGLDARRRGVAAVSDMGLEGCCGGVCGREADLFMALFAKLKLEGSLLFRGKAPVVRLIVSRLFRFKFAVVVNGDHFLVFALFALCVLVALELEIEIELALDLEAFELMELECKRFDISSKLYVGGVEEGSF